MRRLPALAVTLPQFRAETGPAVAACLDAHRLGFAGAFVFDHLWPLGQRDRPAAEGWTLLAALAGAIGAEGSGGLKERSDSPPVGGGSGGLKPSPPVDRGSAGGGTPAPFRLGTLVTRAGLRPAALVARMAATVGQAAGAPPIVGVGRGDLGNRDENLAFGLPFPDADGRTRALEATVAALRGPLAGRPPPTVWVGGTGAAARALAGRLADAWNGWGLTPDELAAGLTDARRAAEAAGRDPAALQATWGGQVLVAGDAAEAATRLDRWAAARPTAQVARIVAGDPEAVLARLGELGDAGATWCVLAPVGGPAEPMRALLAAAAGVPPRHPPAGNSDGAAEP
jgi:alkanesulfonate monooxygenase SsuD/methylene tetrahydromethanopterin reductase-like flavin-dependent oxidoreductase (luciferase family)